MNTNPEVLARHARVLKILHFLRAGPGYNVGQLASQLHVSRRTVFRDLSILRQSGVEMFFDTTADSYRLYADPQTRVPELSEEHLTNLVVASLVSSWNDYPGIGESIQLALSRLLAEQPDPVKLRISWLVKCCKYDRGPRDISSLERDLLLAFVQSISQRKQLRVLVDNEDLAQWQTAAVEGTAAWTKLAPYDLTSSSRGWTITGHSSLHDDIRQFQLQDIVNVIFTDDNFQLPRAWQRRATSAELAAIDSARTTRMSAPESKIAPAGRASSTR